MKFSDPNLQFSVWNIWTETGNMDSFIRLGDVAWTHSHSQGVWSFQLMLNSVYAIWNILILSELYPRYNVEMAEVLHFAEVTRVWVWTDCFTAAFPDVWSCGIVFFTWPVYPL